MFRYLFPNTLNSLQPQIEHADGKTRPGRHRRLADITAERAGWRGLRLDAKEILPALRAYTCRCLHSRRVIVTTRSGQRSDAIPFQPTKPWSSATFTARGPSKPRGGVAPPPPAARRRPSAIRAAIPLQPRMLRHPQNTDATQHGRHGPRSNSQPINSTHSSSGCSSNTARCDSARAIHPPPPSKRSSARVFECRHHVPRSTPTLAVQRMRVLAPIALQLHECGPRTRTGRAPTRFT
jgi:hypothetical protein